MIATESLKNEHKAVKLTLQVLGRICDQSEKDRKFNPEHLDSLVEFFRVFVDKCHHGKEENLLFPAMLQAGISKKGGPIEVMLREHKQGRKYVRGIADAVLKYKTGNIKASSEIIRNSRDYISLLKQHIDKEDNVLYPMADARLDEEKQKELFEGFERIEEERIGWGTHERFHEMIHNLREVYLK